MIDVKYFREYRSKLGFSNQDGVKSFFAAKDIKPEVDYSYIALLNQRLGDVVRKINSVVCDQIRLNDCETFINQKIFQVFKKLKVEGIITKLTNQGRRPEEVYFSWMRGFVMSEYFRRAISVVFEVNEENISFIGDDDFSNIETFKRSQKADLEIKLKNEKKIRIEVQSGFQGVNDIKQAKVLEAKKIASDYYSIVIHFDMFNGQVAFVRTDNISEKDSNWITRQQMEGQTVLNIDQNYFIWKLTESPPKISDFLDL